MRQLIFGVLLLSIVAITFVGITSLPVARADDVCEFTDTNQECNLKIKKLNVEDDFNLKIINGGGSGGGTVDQQARDDIAANSAADAVTNGKVSALESTVSTLQSENADLKAQIQTLNQTLQDAVIGIEIGNGTVVIPPVDNGTGGGNGDGGNGTTGGGDGGNTTDGSGGNTTNGDGGNTTDGGIGNSSNSSGSAFPTSDIINNLGRLFQS